MLEAIEARLRAIGEARALAAARRLADAVRAKVAGVAVDEEQGRVTLSGRGLWRRAIDDPRLRWIAGWLR